MGLKECRLEVSYLLKASVYMLDVSCEVKVGRNVANPSKWHVV